MSKVTVIMPVYNGEKYIRQAVSSILEQTYTDFELICIDDASSDNSVSILESIKDDRIKIYKNDSNRGIAYTRNRGLELANSEYIALLDDDDVAMPYRLEHEVEFLDNHQEIDIVGGHQRQIDGDGKDIGKQWSVFLNPNYIKAYLLLNNAIVNGSTMFRKSLIDKYGIRYKDNMCGAEDYRFWVECSLHGKIKNLDEVMLLWRVAGQNETFSMINTQSEQRRNAIGSIREYALRQTGFDISNEELNLLNKVFYEEEIIEDKYELENLYNVLKNISVQSKQLNLENQKEIVTMCRKRFGEKVGKAFFLWK